MNDLTICCRAKLPDRARTQLHATVMHVAPWRAPELLADFPVCLGGNQQLKEALLVSAHIPPFLNGESYAVDGDGDGYGDGDDGSRQRRRKRKR